MLEATEDDVVVRVVELDGGCVEVSLDVVLTVVVVVGDVVAVEVGDVVLVGGVDVATAVGENSTILLS